MSIPFYGICADRAQMEFKNSALEINSHFVFEQVYKTVNFPPRAAKSLRKSG